MSTSKGKAPAISGSTTGIDAYSKEDLAKEIQRLQTVQSQLLLDKTTLQETNNELEADKGRLASDEVRLINEKNTLVAQRQELRGELANATSSRM